MPNRNLAKCMMLGTGIFIISGQLPLATSAATDSALPSLQAASQTDINAASSPLLAAAEPFEALTEMAFSAQGLRLDSAIVAADDATTRARGSLPPASAAQLDARLAEVHQARKSDDRAALAISSVEAYRILLSAARPGKIPTAVNLMDYAGMRYDADFRAKPVRWSDMKEAAAFAREQWSSISSEIADPILKATVDGAVSDMEMGADQQDTYKARRSAQAELGLVDELEGYFETLVGYR
jgi:hypothetical protein